MADYEDARRVAGTLPEAEAGEALGTPAFYVRHKMFLRLLPDGTSLVVRIHRDERAALMAAEPQKFFVTAHFQNFHYMLVALPATPADEVGELVVESWRRVAPKSLVRQYDRG